MEAMLKQELVLLSFDEIKAIQVECTACKTAVTFPLGKDKSQPRIPEECPNCQAKWKADQTAFNFSDTLIRALLAAQTIATSSFSFRFVVSSEPSLRH